MDASIKWLKSFWKRLWAEGPQRPAALPKSHSETQSALPNFTPLAQQALALARKEADKFYHHFVGTEHVLLGLIALDKGSAVLALRQAGLNLESVRAEIEKQIGPATDQKVFGHIPYTPRVKKVLTLAAKEAKWLNQDRVATGHILLGLLREGDGVAARVLRNLDVNIEKARTVVLETRENGLEDTKQESVRAIVDATEPPSTETSANNLTPRAQRVLLMAQKETERLQLPFISTEHVLLGLSLSHGGVATNVLNKIGLELEVIQTEVEKLAARQPSETSGKQAAYAPRIKEMLAFASREAKELNHTYIGTEHLLLALLKQREGGAAEIFKNRNVNAEEVRKEIIKELSPVYIHHVPGKAPETSHTSTPPPPPQANPAGAPIIGRPRRESIDLKLRYDVYCVERDGKMVVYRNAQFKGIKTLTGTFDYPNTDFAELEQRDGQTIYVAKSSIVKFCQHGVKPEGEEVK